MEVFRDVVGYEGQYKIGSCGTLWSERSRKVLRPNTDKSPLSEEAKKALEAMK